MAKSDDQFPDGTEWSEFVDQTNRSVLRAIDQNVEAQTRFVESWFDAVEQAWARSPETVTEGMESYQRAYEVWMRAAEEQYERIDELLQGEDVGPEEFRDIWLSSANEAFKEVMRTSAFAAATGETVGDTLHVQQQIDEAAEETLQLLGFATTGDVREVGTRLVELERRQHAVEEKLDRILETLGDEDQQ